MNLQQGHETTSKALGLEKSVFSPEGVECKAAQLLGDSQEQYLPND